MPKKKTYKQVNAEYASMSRPRLIPWPELLGLRDDPDNPKIYNPPAHNGWNRKARRRLQFQVRDRRFTRPGEQYKIWDHDQVTYEWRKFLHVMMDHSFERADLKPDPKLSNKDRHKMRIAQRKAHRSFQEAAEAQNA